MRYLLDTSICVYFLRGRFALDDAIVSRGRAACGLSEVTVAELRYGAENSLNPAAKHAALDQFIAGLTILPLFSAIRQYARIKVQLNRMGRPLHDQFDLIIAATALQNGLVLVTDNEKDFVNIAGLQLENWYR